MEYDEFLQRKMQVGCASGFEPLFMPDCLFDFQKHLVEWSVRKGRSAIFADCGMGKTLMQLVWAENVHRKTNKPVLILTPLAVANQTCREAEHFDIEAGQSRDGKLNAGIVVTNYEKLHMFSPDDFSGVVCDESSILKSFSGATKKQVIRFMNKTPYRLLCTATPSPNDYVELGNSSESLGELSHSEMLKRFFRQLDDKSQKKEMKQQDNAERMIALDGNYYQKLAFRVAQTIGQWRLKNHAVQHFWRWITSWARACRKPSDLGFSDERFALPDLLENDHLIEATEPPHGCLFNMPAVGLGAEREERKRTLTQRCEYVASLVNHDRPAVVWCHTNDEGDTLERMIAGSKQVAGRTPDDEKIETYDAFSSGQLRVLVIKPKIGAWGLNWQHCNHVVTFASHSYEQYYQSVRRCWRFGQTNPVKVDIVATSGEERVMENMRKKARSADTMFAALVAEMNNSMSIQRENNYVKQEELPSWL